MVDKCILMYSDVLKTKVLNGLIDSSIAMISCFIPC